MLPRTRSCALRAQYSRTICRHSTSEPRPPRFTLKDLDALERDLNITTPDRWYRERLPCSVDVVVPLLRIKYPLVEWHPWKFFQFDGIRNSRFWLSIHRQGTLWKKKPSFRREYLEWVGRTHLNIQKFADWYSMTLEKIKQYLMPSFVQNLYHGSFSRTVMACFREFSWMPALFAQSFPGVWNHDTKVEYLNRLAKTMNILRYDDWRFSKKAQWLKSGGGKLLAVHGGSVLNTLLKTYPSIPWHPIQFGTVPRGYWDTSRICSYIDYCVTHLESVHRFHDLYQVPSAKLLARHSSTLKKEFQDTNYSVLLQRTYPHWFLTPWSFASVPRNTWNIRGSHRAYLEYVAARLKIQRVADWQSIHLDDFIAASSQKFLNFYNFSLFGALSTQYKEFRWIPQRFAATPQDRNSISDLVMCMAYLEEELCIENVDDWYRVSQQQLRDLGAHTVIHHHGGLLKVLQQFYPSNVWLASKMGLSGSKKSSQRWLWVTLKKIFPRFHVVEEYQNESLKYPDTDTNLEFDVFIQELNLAFEYQGKHHYEDTMIYGLHSLYKGKDDLKKKVADSAGITLIEVPYWWEGDEASLRCTISDVLPGTLERVDGAKPIPKTLPEE